MIKILKRTPAIVLLISLIIVTMMGLNLKVSAMSPALYKFETWTGSGPASVKIGIDYNSFAKLTYGDEEVDRSNYTVTGDGESTVITLKEEYLKALTNADYYFWVYFTPDEPERLPYVLTVEQNEIKIPGTNQSTFVKLTYGDEAIDSSNYTVTTTDGNTIITFKEEYLETLTGENYFEAYFLDAYQMLILQLSVNVQDISTNIPQDIPTSIPRDTPTNIPQDIPTNIPQGTSADISQDTSTDLSLVEFQDNSDSRAPKTGDYASVTVWVLILLLSVASCTGVLKSSNKKDVI